MVEKRVPKMMIDTPVQLILVNYAGKTLLVIQTLVLSGIVQI